MGDENETERTAGIFSSLSGDDVIPPVAHDEVVAELDLDSAPAMDSVGERDRNNVPGKDEPDQVRGRDWTFVLAWVLIGMGLLFVLWALITNG